MIPFDQSTPKSGKVIIAQAEFGPVAVEGLGLNNFVFVQVIVSNTSRLGFEKMYNQKSNIFKKRTMKNAST